MPAVALVGPNELGQWLLPATNQPPEVAKAAPGPVTEPLSVESDSQVQAAAYPPAAVPPMLAGGDGGQASAEAGHTQLHFHAPEPSTPRDRVQQIQHRLQLLGAQYMVLETWGNVVPEYRFYCRMGGSTGVETQHEAIGHDPLMAMQAVLREVEQGVIR